MGRHLNYSGLVIAGTGFFLTRFTVTLTIYDNPLRFYLAGVVPLALGLGLAAFGVALTVADVETGLVRTTAAWCVFGTVTMAGLVTLTLLGSTPGGLPDPATVQSRTYFSNFLIGGSIGGTLTGLYAARTRRHQQALQRQANRLEVLNRILRHEVLNAVAAIRGYSNLENAPGDEARQVIEDKSNVIVRTIEDVKYLARSGSPDQGSYGPVDLAACLEESIAAVTDAHPAVDVTVDPPPEGVSVHANDRLGQVFIQLLENAAVHTPAGTPTVDVAATTTASSVRVSISDDGAGLPAKQRALLETGDINTYDDPGTGFGLNLVRLLVEEYGGTIETAVDDAGTTITVVLPRTGGQGAGLALRQSALSGVATPIPHLVVTLGAAVVAGVGYGIAAELLGGSVGFIGVYYGVEDTVVGWIAHEFHSVVFAFMFASLVSVAPESYRESVPAYVAIGTAWGLVLWIVAAGFISPIWLQLLGIPVPIPSISTLLLVTHVVWGSSLGLLTALGYRHLAPWLGRRSAGSH